MTKRDIIPDLENVVRFDHTDQRSIAQRCSVAKKKTFPSFYSRLMTLAYDDKTKAVPLIRRVETQLFQVWINSR